MQADQAAGLRSKPLRARVQTVSLFATQPGFALRLAHALQARHGRVLLIDSAGCHALAAKTQSIFAWEQQVARQRLQTISIQGVDVLHAPDVLGGEAAIVQAGAAYDYVLFDGHHLQSERVALDPRTSQTFIVEVSAQPEATCNAYALLKTLYQHKLDGRVFLWGDPAGCERVISATHFFLQAHLGLWEVLSGEGDAHLAALAAKISAAEISTNRLLDKNTGGECAQYG